MPTIMAATESKVQAETAMSVRAKKCILPEGQKNCQSDL